MQIFALKSFIAFGKNGWFNNKKRNELIKFQKRNKFQKKYIFELNEKNLSSEFSYFLLFQFRSFDDP